MRFWLRVAFNTSSLIVDWLKLVSVEYYVDGSYLRLFVYFTTCLFIV